MSAKKTKSAFVKGLEADFAKKFRVILKPMKGDIRRLIDKGQTAHDAVDQVFRERNIRTHLTNLILDAMVEAARHD
jgi:hypothetical protein